MDTRIPFVLDDDLLQDLWRSWRPRIDALRASGVPLCMADEEGGSEGGEGAGEGEEGTGKGSEAGADDAEDDDDGEDDEVAKAQAENVALKRRLGEAEKARKRAERELRQKTAKDQAAQGEYKEMFEAEKKRADELEGKLRKGALNRAIVAAATEQRFRNPSIVPSLVTVADAVDEDGEVDETLVKNAVTALAKRETYLVREPEKPQGEVRGERRPAVANGDRGGAGDQAPGLDRIRKAYAATPAGRQRT